MPPVVIEYHSVVDFGGGVCGDGAAAGFKVSHPVCASNGKNTRSNPLQHENVSISLYKPLGTSYYVTAIVA